MPLFSNLTTKIRTTFSISPSSSPSSSPTSSHPSTGFEVRAGRRESGFVVKRPKTTDRVDSFMTDMMDETPNASQESVDSTPKKQRRVSRFREELSFEDEL
ncbi:hypothetical protein GQ44DRAFT_251564 [Phaeosphaeriaceae sp. PMI808]|nr:hypothetical protein GQ44DRAFT_251564 [Phaeosphaeriaceae sp. PMI808]